LKTLVQQRHFLTRYSYAVGVYESYDAGVVCRLLSVVRLYCNMYIVAKC